MRTELWEARLADLIAAAADREFQYGTWDCARFACAAIAVCTGTNPGDEFRGYAGERECAELLADQGGLRAIAERVASARGFRAIAPRLAQRGDVVLGVIAGRETLGVCIGASVAFAAHPRGLVRIRITDPALSSAWRIQ